MGFMWCDLSSVCAKLVLCKTVEFMLFVVLRRCAVSYQIKSRPWEKVLLGWRSWMQMSQASVRKVLCGFYLICIACAVQLDIDWTIRGLSGDVTRWQVGLLSWTGFTCFSIKQPAYIVTSQVTSWFSHRNYLYQSQYILFPSHRPPSPFTNHIFTSSSVSQHIPSISTL